MQEGFAAPLCEIARQAVRIADGDRGEHGGALRREGQPVSGAFARLETADARHPRPQRQDGPQAAPGVAFRCRLPHAEQREAGPREGERLRLPAQEAGAREEVRLAHEEAGRLQKGRQSGKAPDLFTRERLLLRARAVCLAKMREDAGDAQGRQPRNPAERGHILRRDAEPVHPRVGGEVDAHAPSLRRELTRVRLVDNGLRQPPADEQLRLRGRRPAENQDRSPEKRPAERDALLERRDGKRAHAAAAQRPGAGDGAVPVGVRLDDRHQLRALSGEAAKQRGVLPQRAEIDLAPRPPVGPRLFGQQGGGKREQGGERQHREKVPQAVFHKLLFQREQLCAAAHEHNAPRMHDVKHGGEPPRRPVLPRVLREQERKQQHAAQRQQQVHGVVALPARVFEEKGFRAHRGE